MTANLSLEGGQSLPPKGVVRAFMTEWPGQRGNRDIPEKHSKDTHSRDFPGGPVAKTPHSQCREPGFEPWSGNLIAHAATKSLHATTKDPTCHNKDGGAHVLQLRPSAGKQITNEDQRRYAF